MFYRSCIFYICNLWISLLAGTGEQSKQAGTRRSTILEGYGRIEVGFILCTYLCFPCIFWFSKAQGISQVESGHLTGPKTTDPPNHVS